MITSKKNQNIQPNNRTIPVQSVETSKIQHIKVNKEKQVQQAVLRQQNVQKEKPIEEDKVKVEKEVHYFSIQKELEKVKIPIPLTELVKQPAYKKQTSYFINLS